MSAAQIASSNVPVGTVSSAAGHVMATQIVKMDLMKRTVSH